MHHLPFKHRRLKISYHQDTFRLRPHEYTSYIPLLCLLTVVGVVMGVVTVYAQARPGPAAGSIGISGQMPAKPPTEGAVITSPANGQHFGTSPITIKGTCPKNILVEIYKNDIFAGSTYCSETGNFELQADLMYGQNKLIARVYDELNQPGPDSPAVQISYDAAQQSGEAFSRLSFGGAQMLLNTDAVFRGIFPEQEMGMPLSIIGGVPPFAVEVQWGDSSNKIIPRGDNLTFNATHNYKKAGVYQVTVQATDSQQRVAFLTVAVIVNGQPDTTGAAGSSGEGSGGDKSGGTSAKLMALWPLYTASFAVVTSFWLGERREKRVILKQYIIEPSRNQLSTK